MNLIFLGAPGAGKGTQAEKVCDLLKIPAISTGNILREAVKNGTEMGQKAKSYMDAGNLVPDDVIIGIVKERLAQSDCENGFVLDGVPRTVAQAEALDEAGVRIDRVVNIQVEDDAIVRRMSGRRVCSDCGASYHTDYKPSKIDGVCDKCGGKLVIRKDDQESIVKDRLQVYHDLTEPLIAYYEKKGVLKTVIGQERVEDTSELVRRALGV
ncbi:adenylate kinase [Acetanaerobacterium sp. MSJ-12]|uniref:Adenylate kinase n=1 Tax=Bittarella massiliensis (ex Durand et al. 2017) TaxID=1720313 RepID=A0AAP1LH44_9FIRM|nr:MULTISPECIES: adenylate kinase [Eubacteriales]ERI98425.1 adenylate kinase [Clostridium sp. ATCC 29733]MBC2871304.1 adenylate kinase [Bittarella massiliensis (ex Durand et al. 2017)]MBU5419198.1 adenylate kinase [Acetanaerobacterium sp. MSJ-12]MCQ4949407.1 adenylate kinase [Bittarella massiliensis (ex Durand et al. 2017)]MZL70588.1 adenylate kinase [Bittarella massiliensis (ex Durand et al. 2017)]